MSNRNSNLVERREFTADHQHDGRAICASVGHEAGRVRIDYVCRQCGAEWFETRPAMPSASTDTPRCSPPVFRRKPDRRNQPK